MSTTPETTLKNWRSIAYWPKGTCSGDRSEDTHYSQDEANAVCRLLQKRGFGGDGKVFPIRTEAEPITRAGSGEHSDQGGKSDETNGAPYWLCRGLAADAEHQDCANGTDTSCDQTSLCVTEYCMPCAAKAWMNDQRRLEAPSSTDEAAQEGDPEQPAWFNEITDKDKAAELILYICQKSKDDPHFDNEKLNAILFEIDRRAFITIFSNPSVTPVTRAKRLPLTARPSRNLTPCHPVSVLIAKSHTQSI